MFVEGQHIGRRVVKELEIADITGALSEADRVGRDIRIPDNPHAAEMQRAAEQTRMVYDSPEFQSKLRDETERIKDATIGDQFAAYYKEADELVNGGQLGQDERLYLFVSASMPTHVVRTYVADVARLKDPRISVVMRGFIDGMSKIGPTVNFVAEILRKDPACNMADGNNCDMFQTNFMIDPLLFSRYGVEEVQSFVYVRGIKPSDPGMSEGSAANLTQGGHSFKVSGDASLKYIMEKIGSAANSESLQLAAGKL